MLDRSTPPPIKEVETLTIPEFDTCCLPTGIVQDRQPLTEKFTAAMLREGASGLSSAYIAEKLDYYGATLQT